MGLFFNTQISPLFNTLFPLCITSSWLLTWLENITLVFFFLKFFFTSQKYWVFPENKKKYFFLLRSQCLHLCLLTGRAPSFSEEADTCFYAHWSDNGLTSSLPIKRGCIIAKAVWIKEKMVIFSAQLKCPRNLAAGSECRHLRKIGSQKKAEEKKRKL